MEKFSLRYIDERDKSYGIAGMTITLVACDAANLLSEIHLDAEPGECMVMTHDFGLKGNPRMSAKLLWEQTVSDLRTTTSMALGNIACRRYVKEQRRLSDRDTEPIREAVRGEALEHCELDRDEADSLFSHCLTFVDRVFRHATVQDAAHSFAAELAQRRSMSVNEAIELLARMGLR